MLRIVLENYLDKVAEREFDLPFLALLPVLGFHDVHFTHGAVEFGKDFIAKKKSDGEINQYSFQVKAGNINQSYFRNHIQGQLLEVITTTLSHPNFDKTLPQQVVLVITGKLSGNASLELKNLNEGFLKEHGMSPVIVWDRENLLTFLENDGFRAIFSSRGTRIKSLGNFYLIYGKCLTDDFSSVDIENQTTDWILESTVSNESLLTSTIQIEVIAQELLSKGLFYDAIYSYLGLIRICLFMSYQDHDDELNLNIFYDELLRILNSLCYKAVSKINKKWLSNNKDLLKMMDSVSPMITYLVNCARILEMSGLLYFLAHDTQVKAEILDFIIDFIKHETGCKHIPSDNYAVSIVLPVIALIDSSYVKEASEFLKDVTIWICDRYEDGLGLAPFGSNAEREIELLLGSHFEFYEKNRPISSFLSTTALDLAAYLNDESLYLDMVNDLIASNIYPTYWQIQKDSLSVFLIGGKDIVSYPNIEFFENLNDLNDLKYSQHIIHELKRYKVSDEFGPLSVMTIMLFIRDRYFPTIWRYMGRN